MVRRDRPYQARAVRRPFASGGSFYLTSPLGPIDVVCNIRNIFEYFILNFQAFSWLLIHSMYDGAVINRRN